MINSGFRRIIFFLGIALLSFAHTAGAGDKGQSFEATLVWGTNTPEPADSKLKPVPVEVARKLKELPFKWSHYYLVESKSFSVAQGKRKSVDMSEQCQIVVRPIEENKVELSLRGEGKPVGKVTQKLPRNEMLVIGGNAENLTAWFVVLRRAE